MRNAWQMVRSAGVALRRKVGGADQAVEDFILDIGTEYTPAPPPAPAMSNLHWWGIQSWMPSPYLFEERFIGNDGDSVNATRWPNSSVSGVADIQGNQCRLQTSTTQWDDTQIEKSHPADFDITWDWEIQQVTNWHFPFVIYRGDTWGLGLGNYYRVAVDISGGGGSCQVYVERCDGFTGTTVASGTNVALATNDILHVRLMTSGNTHNVKWWKNSDGEPGTWGYTFTQSAYNTQTSLHFGIQNATVGTATRVDVDNVIIL